MVDSEEVSEAGYSTEALPGKPRPPCSFFAAVDIGAGSSIPEASSMDPLFLSGWLYKCNLTHPTMV